MKRHPELPQVGDVRRIASLKGCTAIVFGDRHIWPGEELNCADRALHYLIKKLKPRLIVDNGDLFDLPTISRHGRGHGYFPDVADELEAGRAYLALIEKIAPKDAFLVRCIGNHDHRFITSLAQRAPEFLTVFGTCLEKTLPNWNHCWQLLINKRVMVTHWWHTNANAARDNILKSGADAFVSNHLHDGNIASWTDFDGHVRWGISVGCMAEFDCTQRKFTHYTRGVPLRWKQGFCVLTFDDQGRLLPPELVQVIRGDAYFRGQRL